MKTLHEVLEFLEQHIDADHVRQTKEKLKGVLEHNNTAPCLAVAYPQQLFQGYPYGQAYDDMEKMLHNELVSLVSGVMLKDDSLPCIRANYGVGSLASLFGVTCTVVNNSMPWVTPCETLDQVRAIAERGVPDLRAGLGGKIFDTYAYYQEVLQNYPGCRESIMIYHPDMQGPFDILHLICGNNLYYWLYDEPELIHTMLQLICQTYIAFMNKIKPCINDEYEGRFCAQFTSLWGGRIVLRDDTAVNLSPEQYEEFIRPYDEQLLEAFGGGSIHYCGRAKQIEKDFLNTKFLKGMNYGYMPNHEFGEPFLQTIYPLFCEKRVPLINYVLSNEEAACFPTHRYSRGVSYQTSAATMEDARVLMETFRQA